MFNWVEFRVAVQTDNVIPMRNVNLNGIISYDYRLNNRRDIISTHSCRLFLSNRRSDQISKFLLQKIRQSSLMTFKLILHS